MTCQKIIRATADDSRPTVLVKDGAPHVECGAPAAATVSTISRGRNREIGKFCEGHATKYRDDGWHVEAIS